MIYSRELVDFGKGAKAYFLVCCLICLIFRKIMTIAQFDRLGIEEKKKMLYQCCCSAAWVERMLSSPPANDLIDLLEDAEECWYSLGEEDWREALSKQPRADDLESLSRKFGNEGMLGEDHPGISTASEQTLQALADGSKAYEQKFGYSFITSDAGKSAIETLGMLTARLQNKPETEITVAMSEQSKIIQQNLERLFGVSGD